MRRLRLVPVVMLIAFAAFFTVALPMNPDAVEQWIRARGWLGPAVFAGLMIAGILFSPIPTSPLTLMSARLFGFWGGLLLTLISATVGALLAFLIARKLGDRLLTRYPRFNRLRHLLPPDVSAYAVLLLRLPPSPTFDAVSYLAGLTDMKPWQFVVATFVGMVPVTATLCYAGKLLPSAWLWPLVAALIVGGAISGWRASRTRRNPEVERPPES